MKQKHDSTDTYHIYMVNRILTLAPIIGATAAFTFTLNRITGHFSFVEPWELILFDAVCLSYFVVAGLLKKLPIVHDNLYNPKVLFTVEMVLDILVLLQWNLISYIFPARTFWGYAPMFVLLTAFTFHTRAVLMEISGISVSIAISWVLMGDELLPYADDMFADNLGMRIVALVTSFVVIYILTYYAEKFTVLVKENQKAMGQQQKELETMSRDVIDFTADIIEERDATSGSHVKRLKTYTRILAEQVAKDYPEYGLSPEKIEQITLACVLHDVGKIAIPDSILQKPGKLTPEEFEIIKTHTTLGARIIDKLPDSVGEDYKTCCREICQFHHEKYDGKGYPAGLRGDDIPIAAQIVSFVDCFDALSTERPYKSALPGKVALTMILNGECGVFSDKIKSSVLACWDRLLNA